MPKSGRLTNALVQRLIPIRAVLFDVEGTLIDSGTIETGRGLDPKALSVKDRETIRRAVDAGFLIGIITSKTGGSIDRLAAAAGITDVYQGYLDKSSAYGEFKFTHNLSDDQIAYMGDDILDLSVIRTVGFSAAPANAHSSVRLAAQYVCRARGGEGAAAEMLSLLLEIVKKGTGSGESV
jgi:3-deoxy-D-manno-octulosonate 8-phosphate phosphatase (KDO 8-P phosphatase)